MKVEELLMLLQKVPKDLEVQVRSVGSMAYNDVLTLTLEQHRTPAIIVIRPLDWAMKIRQDREEVTTDGTN